MDITRVVTFSQGGRPIVQKDIETGTTYAKVRDSFSITPGDKHPLLVSANRRYGGQKTVGESHDNWALQASWLINGATADQCLANAEAFLAQLETIPVGRFIEWRPDGATYSDFYEIRGTAKWNPQYKWVSFAGAQVLIVEAVIPIAPLARGLPMDILDPFDVDSISDYTFDAGTGTTGAPPGSWTSGVTALTPALWWRLGETVGTTAADASGNGRTGTYGSGVTLNQTGALTGDSDKAVSLDNSANGAITSTYAPFTNGTTRTFIGWAWRNATTDTDAIFAGDGGSHPVLRNVSGSSDVEWFMDIGGAGVSWVGAWPGTAQWVFWALTVNESTDTMELFINGVSKGTRTSAVSYNAAAGNFVVGRRSGSADPFNGKQDDVAAFTSILTGAQILDLYNRGIQQGVSADVTISGGTLNAVSGSTPLTGERRMIHTARGYSYGDHDVVVKTVPGSTITGYKIGACLKRIDASNYLEVYIDDNGTNSRLRVDKVTTAGGRVNLDTVNLAARITTGAPVWVRGRLEGNVVYAEHWASTPKLQAGGTTPRSYQLTTAEAAIFGETVRGYGGISWIPQHASATVDDVSVNAFVYAGARLPDDWKLRGQIYGDAPAIVDLVAGIPSSTNTDFAALGWQPEPAVHNQCWNGDFEEDTNGWSVAAVTNINGAATSITRQTSASKYGAAAAEIITPATSGTGANFRIYRRFRRGILYTADVWMFAPVSTTSVSVRLGNGAANDVATSVGVALTGNWQKISIAWTPTAERDDAHLALIINAATATTFRIDGIQVYEGTTAPSLISQTEGRGAYPPFGVIEGEACDAGDLTNFAITAGGERSGFHLAWSGIGGSATGTAAWFVDPNLLAADDFAGDEVQVEVWAAMELAASLTACKVTLSAFPADVGDLGTTNNRYTAEWGSSGRSLIGYANSNARKFHRLGTLTLTSRPGRAPRWKVKASITAAGVASTINLDYLFMVPARRRCCGPSGKPAAGYPGFVPPLGFDVQKRICGVDLSGWMGVDGGSPVTSPSSGLGGSLIEMPPGQTRIALKVGTVPDEPDPGGLIDSAVNNAGVRFSVWPRWQLARDA